MENFKAIYRILRYLEQAMDYDEPDLECISAEKLGLTEQRWAAIIELLVDKGYIAGVKVKRCIDGSVLISMSEPRITLDGLEYLAEDLFMQENAVVESQP